MYVAAVASAAPNTSIAIAANNPAARRVTVPWPLPHMRSPLISAYERRSVSNSAGSGQWDLRSPPSGTTVIITARRAFYVSPTRQAARGPHIQRFLDDEELAFLSTAPARRRGGDRDERLRPRTASRAWTLVPVTSRQVDVGTEGFATGRQRLPRPGALTPARRLNQLGTPLLILEHVAWIRVRREYRGEAVETSNRFPSRCFVASAKSKS